jgi:two-component system, cell cycle response regulator DivK
MKSLLYVEDDAINALIVRKLLQKEFKVLIANDSQSCFTHLNNQPFDLILMDINLGDAHADGVSIMQKIKQHPNGKNVKVLAVTAFSLPEDREKYMKTGFDGYVVKPIDEADLLHAIAQALN